MITLTRQQCRSLRHVLGKAGAGLPARASPLHGMNKTESAYALQLEARKQAGHILWWMFEPCGLRLAGGTFYHPDFMVMRADGVIEFHEVKGFWRDDARVKIKVAAERFPFVFLAVKRAPGRSGGWDREEF